MKINLNLKNIDKNLDLSMVAIELDHLIINPDKRVFAVLKDENDRKVGLEVNNFEATMLSFAHKKFFLNSHINTIYELFLKSLESNNSEIENISIESKVGDITYSTIKIIDKDFNRSYSVLSLADALIISRFLNKKIYCAANLWDDFDEISDWDYEDYILDIDDEDED